MGRSVMGIVLRVVPVFVLALLALMVPRGSAAAEAKKYACIKLITDAEMQTAAGVSGAVLAVQRFGTDQGEPAESTSCQFSAKQGALSIGLTMATGAAVALYDAAVFSGPAGGRETLPGIGDAAVLVPQGRFGGARTHGVVILVKFQANRTSALDGVDVKGSVTRILKLVVGRV
jgi:hypothetical protein